MVARLHLTDAIVPTTDGWGIVIQRFNAELAPSDVDEVLAALGDRADRLRALFIGSRHLDAKALRTWTKWQGLRHFRFLSLAGGRVGITGLRSLLKSPHIAGLEDVDLSNCGCGKAKHLGLLGESTALPALKGLLLSSEHSAKSDKELTALLDGAAFEALERLAIVGWKLDFSDYSRLGASGLGRNLRHLDVSGQMRAGYKFNALFYELGQGDGALESLDMSYCFRNLPLGDWNVGPYRKGQARLPRLRRLSLAHGCTSEKKMRSLCEAHFFPQLHEVCLDWDDPTCVEPLLAHTDVSLKVLRLVGENVAKRPAVLERLATWPPGHQPWSWT